MRMKMVVVALLALFAGNMVVSDVAYAQGQRRPREPENTVPPLQLRPRTTPMQNIAPPALSPADTWVLDLSNGGRIQIQLRPDIAPHHVERIKTLTEQGFYNGLAFHRVIEGFMAQGGDPLGTGAGGSQLPDLHSEFNDLPHLRGAVAMARAQSPDSANSQFFIMFAPASSLDGQYTIWGRVVDGMDAVDKIKRGTGGNGIVQGPDRLVKARIAADAPPEAPPAAEAAPAG
jgi:cyclophilin family peptidyl-prolyl cis-trans isomerase